MFDFKVWLRSFAAAWELLLDFPLPSFGKRRRASAPPPPFAVLCFFPVIGALAGVLAAFLGGFVAGVSNRIAGALLFGALALAFSELKDSGRGTSMLCTWFLARLRGQTLGAVLPHLRANRDVYADPTAQMALVVLLVVRYLLFFLLGGWGGRFWFAGVLIASFALQGDLAACGGTGGAPPLLAVTPEQRRYHWILAAVLLAALMVPFFPLAAVATGAITWILAGAYARMMERECGGMDPDAITMAGTLTEWLALVIGILWAIRL